MYTWAILNQIFEDRFLFDRGSIPDAERGDENEIEAQKIFKIRFYNLMRQYFQNREYILDTFASNRESSFFEGFKQTHKNKHIKPI